MDGLSAQNRVSSAKAGKYKSSAFKLSKKDLLAVAENAPDVICRFDKKFRLLFVNPAIELATGVPPKAFINKTTRQLGMPEEHSAIWEEQISRVVSTGAQVSHEFPFLTPSGLRFFQTILVPEFSGGVVRTVLTVSRDITEKKELERRKEETFCFVGHELKTPVTSLKLVTQILQRKMVRVGNRLMAEDLARMDKQIDKMTNIISDLLDTTRLEHGSLKLQKEEFDFDELVKEVVEEIRKSSPSHKIKIVGKTRKSVSADRLRIAQVLTNLMSNAIRYCSDKSQIIVSVSSDLKVVTCSVQDFGIGIPAGQKKRIFERFYRVKEHEQKFQSGLGLGLYISSGIIKGHGGKIWVKSKIGAGSTFFFTLPLK